MPIFYYFIIFKNFQYYLTNIINYNYREEIYLNQTLVVVARMLIQEK